MEYRSGQKLLRNRSKIAARSIELLLKKRPDLKKRLNRLSLLKMHRDLSDSIANLSGSIVANDPGLFRDHIIWSENYYKHRGINPDLLTDQLEVLIKSIQESGTTGLDDDPSQFLNDGLSFLHQQKIEPDTHEEIALTSKSTRYVQLLLDGDKHGAETFIQDLIDSDQDVKEIITQVAQPALYEIGRLWHTNQISSRMENCASRINRNIILGLFDSYKEPTTVRGKCALYSPTGELHDLGITILAELLKERDIEVHKFGPNIPDNEFIACLINMKPSVIGISITMAYSLVPLENLIRKIRNHPELIGLKIIAGGYMANKLSSTEQCAGADAIAKDLKQGIDCIVKAIEFE